jgi:hypothetical protein
VPSALPLLLRSWTFRGPFGSQYRVALQRSRRFKVLSPLAAAHRVDEWLRGSFEQTRLWEVHRALGGDPGRLTSCGSGDRSRELREGLLRALERGRLFVLEIPSVSVRSGGHAAQKKPEQVEPKARPSTSKPAQREVFTIDLHIDPADPRTHDDVYILLNEDGTEHERRTVTDDQVGGDDKLTLLFSGLRRGLRYSLRIDEGREGAHYAFRDVLLEDLLEADGAPDAIVDGVQLQSEPSDYAELELDDDLAGVPDRAPPRQTAPRAISERPPKDRADEAVH